MKKRIIWQNIFLILFGSLLTLTTGEMILRLIEPRTDAKIFTSEALPSGRRYIHLISDTTGIILGRSVSINAAGYRGKLVAEQKPAGVLCIGVFGDSHTFWFGADDNSSYPAIVEKLLNADGKCNYEVLNFGVGGHDLTQVIEHARRFAFRFHLDVVLLTYHQGDLLESASGDIIVQGRHHAQGDSSSSGSSLRKLRDQLCEFSAVARLLIPQISALARKAGILQNTSIAERELNAIKNNDASWRDMRQKLLGFVSDAKREHMTVMLVLFPHMQDFSNHPAASLYEVLDRWCEANKIPCVNLLPAFQGHRVGSLRASILDHHPNEEGYAIAGSRVAALLKNNSSLR